MAPRSVQGEFGKERKMVLDFVSLKQTPCEQADGNKFAMKLLRACEALETEL